MKEYVADAEVSFLLVSRAMHTQAHYFVINQIKEIIPREGWGEKVHGFTLNQSFHTSGLILSFSLLGRKMEKLRSGRLHPRSLPGPFLHLFVYQTKKTYQRRQDRT